MWLHFVIERFRTWFRNALTNRLLSTHTSSKSAVLATSRNAICSPIERIILLLNCNLLSLAIQHTLRFIMFAFSINYYLPFLKKYTHFPIPWVLLTIRLSIAWWWLLLSKLLKFYLLLFYFDASDGLICVLFRLKPHLKLNESVVVVIW